ncbi:hypothetical protein LAZ67_16001049 [Cordylochernes scorpioides]|uniref:STPR domain-containing protein n=1 Tax=Cordylochernes scorpioides TaxID=51811 RepID=A0ABY6LF77_9ARAC|nr:hypothetical protein LAZ67_16001049 [Cordylochernes scorpioides]
MRPKKYNSEEERKAAAAERRRNARQQETADQRAERLQRDAEAKRIKLDSETAEQRAARLLRNFETYRSRIDNETAEQHAARHLRNAETYRSRIDNETAEQRAARLLRNAETYRSRIDNETAEQRAARLLRNAETYRSHIDNETAEQHAARLLRNAETYRSRIDNETAEQRAARLLRNAETYRSRIDNETAEQHAARLLRNAETYISRIENETAEQHAARLLRNAETYRSRIDNETAEQHAARPQRDAEAHRRFRRPAMQTNAIDLANIDEKEIIEFYCGQMNERCEFCNSLNFMGERPPDKKLTACCHKGKIELPEQDYPEYLETLMNGVDHNSKNIMENIRSYNSSLAFASMGANIATPPGYGPYCFRIHGQIYHRTGTLHPVGEQPPKFAQLYILDTAEATIERLSIPENHGCDENVLNKLAELLANINKFAMSYKMLRVRRYNKPTASEVAVVFQNDDGEPPFIRDILIHLKPIENQPMLKRISILDPNLDALVYPLFYPRSEQGWTTYLKQKPGSSQRLSQMQYYSYLLSVRDKFNPL